MEILQIRKELNKLPKKVEVEKLLIEAKDSIDTIFYFDRENSHKDMMNLVETFENEDFNVHFREIKYGLGDDEYLYEVHLIQFN